MDCLAVDPDQEALTVLLEEGPEDMAIDPVSGALSRAIPEYATVEYALRIVVQEEAGMVATQEYTLSISIAE